MADNRRAATANANIDEGHKNERNESMFALCSVQEWPAGKFLSLNRPNFGAFFKTALCASSESDSK
ncbi:MAG: hypothetical protein WAV02_22095 [Stellaceae bacterium]